MLGVRGSLTLLLDPALINHHVVLLALAAVRGRLLGQSEASLCSCGAGKVLAALGVRLSGH